MSCILSWISMANLPAKNPIKTCKNDDERKERHVPNIFKFLRKKTSTIISFWIPFISKSFIIVLSFFFFTIGTIAFLMFNDKTFSAHYLPNISYIVSFHSIKVSVYVKVPCFIHVLLSYEFFEQTIFRTNRTKTWKYQCLIKMICSVWLVSFISLHHQFEINEMVIFIFILYAQTGCHTYQIKRLTNGDVSISDVIWMLVSLLHKLNH